MKLHKVSVASYRQASGPSPLETSLNQSRLSWAGAGEGQTDFLPAWNDWSLCFLQHPIFFLVPPKPSRTPPSPLGGILGPEDGVPLKTSEPESQAAGVQLWP